MSTILVLTSSALGDASTSGLLIDEAVAKLQAQQPGATIIRRDVGGSPLPHLTENTVGIIRGAEATNDEQVAAKKLAAELVGELQAADTVLIGAPMYNFGITSTLKTWFDHVLQVGVTFRYTENGPEGLLSGKRAIVVETRGGLYSEGPAQVMDAQEPHLRGMLGFIGISDVTFVRAEKLAFGDEAREESLTGARKALDGAFAAAA